MESGATPHPTEDHQYGPEQIWTLYYQGQYIEVRIEVSKDKEDAGKKYKRVWDLLALSPRSLENLSTDGVIKLLEETLKTFGYLGLIAPQKPDYTIALRDCRKKDK